MLKAWQFHAPALTTAARPGAPESRIASWLELAAGPTLGLVRWRGIATPSEPLLSILHLGYGWLTLGFILLGSMAWRWWCRRRGACTP